MRQVALLLATMMATACASEPAGPTVIYLNRGGATLTAGSDDAAQSVSSLVTSHTTVAPSSLSDAGWNQVVACVRRAYAPFAVEIVDSRPAHDNFSMVVFGGNGSELGRGADQRGIAPFDTGSCETIDNAVVFVFTENLDDNVAAACDVAVHELAHTFGIDHQLLAATPTSYLPFAGVRTFQNVDAQCGEDTARECACGGATQNSFEILADRLGLADNVDVDAPELEVTTTIGARGSINIRVHVEDSSALAGVTLHYADGSAAFTSTCGDGKTSCTSFGNDYTFTVSGATGMAVLHAEAVDMFGNAATSAPIQQPM